MAVIDFLKESDRAVVMAMIAPTQEQKKLKRIAYLSKNGLTHPDIATLKKIDTRAYW